MGSGEKLTITLIGGAPWGFRLQGGGILPLQVSKIRKKSQAHAQGIKEGDAVLSINGVPIAGRTHDESMELIDNSADSLVLEIFRGDLQDLSTLAPTSVAMVNGHVSKERPEIQKTSAASTIVSNDGNTRRDIRTESSVQSGDGVQTGQYVRTEKVSSVVKDTWTPTQHPLPPLVDTQVTSQPYTSTPVQVQVSAMFGANQGGMKENIAPQGSHGGSNIPAFKVRKISSTTNVKQETWQPSILQQTRSQNNANAVLNLREPGLLFGEPPRRQSLHQQQQQQQQQQPQQIYEPEPPKPVPVPDVNTEDHHAKHHKLHVFAPPVQISLDGRPSDLDLVRTQSLESEVSTPDSSSHGKKLFSDSAFYDDPNNKFPTIQEQMKLCKIIASSLTSAANKKARGAKMFAKRQRKSTKWIHEAHSGVSDKSSSAGDVADLDDLDSEIYVTEGGKKPLFTFRIPNIKHRVTSPEEETKMSLTAEEFEKLRLEQPRCQHQSVPPNQCFDIVKDLKTSKGRGGRLFEKRRAKSGKWVIDESNAMKPATNVPTNKLQGMLNKPLKASVSPWEAALENQDGSVEAAFEHLSEYERMQKLNQILKLPQPPPPTVPSPAEPILPAPSVKHTSLHAENQPHLLQGPNFNRVARGWKAPSSDSSLSEVLHPSKINAPPPVAPKPAKLPVHFGDYNPKPKAWHSPGESMVSSPSEPQSQGTGLAASNGRDSYTNGRNVTSPTGYRPVPSFPAPQGMYNSSPMYTSGPAPHAVLPGSDL